VLDADGFAIAALGVGGTLLSSVITQVLARRSRREEIQAAERQRAEDRDSTREEQRFDQRRQCYIRMNASSRRYRIALMNYLHGVHRGGVTDDEERDLRDSRGDYIAGVAELQLTAPLNVLDTTRLVTDNLSWAFRAVKQLQAGTPVEHGGFEEIERFLVRLWDDWEVMRAAMRRDLGVPD
jgi:hypothetical protein